MVPWDRLSRRSSSVQARERQRIALLVWAPQFVGRDAVMPRPLCRVAPPQPGAGRYLRIEAGWSASWVIDVFRSLSVTSFLGIQQFGFFWQISRCSSFLCDF
jgi:hypothetical protein